MAAAHAASNSTPGSGNPGSGGGHPQGQTLADFLQTLGDQHSLVPGEGVNNVMNFQKTIFFFFFLLWIYYRAFFYFIG